MTQLGLSPSGPNPLIQTLKMTDALIRRYLVDLHPRRGICVQTASSGIESQRVRTQDPARQVCLQHSGGLSSSGKRKTGQVQQETPLKAALQLRDWKY